MTDRQFNAGAAILVGVGLAAAAKVVVAGQGAAFGLSGAETTVLVGIGASLVVAVLAAKRA